MGDERAVRPEELDDVTFSRLFGDEDVQEQAAAEPAHPPGRKMRAPSSDKLSVLRNFPTVLVKIARMEFPEAKNNTDAVVAYLCCFCPELMENNSLRQVLTLDQSALIKEHPESSYTTMASRMLAIKKKLDNLSNDALFLQAITLYTLYDRLGLRMESPDFSAVEGVDLEDRGHFLEFFEQMEKAVQSLKARKAAKDGRPLNF